MIQKEMNSKLKINSTGILKYSNWLLSISIFMVICIFTIYFCNFNNGISHDSNDWGNMGDFIGGILGPILSLFSTILVVLTIRLSIENLKDTKNQNSIEKLYTLIFRIEDEISKKPIPINLPKYKPVNNNIQRTANEYTAVQIANMYKLLYHWLERVSDIDKFDAVAIHMAQKHGAMVRKLDKNNWFIAVDGENSKICDYFNRQSARLFRDDI